MKFLFHMSSSAPNILEYETEPILEANVKTQIASVQNKSTFIGERTPSYRGPYPSYEFHNNNYSNSNSNNNNNNNNPGRRHHHHHRHRHLSQPNEFFDPRRSRSLAKDIVPHNSDHILVVENEKTCRHNHYRPELNTIRNRRRRAVLKNGDCNVIQVHIAERGRRYLQDIFTTLVDAQWRWTFLAFFMSFLLSWFAFALLWWLIAYSHGDLLVENRNNASWTPCVTNMDGLISGFLYSMETQTSTGYGSRYPTSECIESVILVCIQSIIGVMIQAFMVGIVFAKMARPKQRKQTLLFSRNCVICQRDGQLCLQFRVGDMREKSHLINPTIRCYLIQTRQTQEGELLSPYLQELNVQVDDFNESVFFIWPLNIVHKINIESPLYDMSAADLLYEKFEIVSLLEGTSESTGQITQVRTSYVPSEILWGHRFEPMVKYHKEKMSYEVDYIKFHNTYQVDTPLCSADELQRFLLGRSYVNGSSDQGL